MLFFLSFRQIFAEDLHLIETGAVSSKNGQNITTKRRAVFAGQTKKSFRRIEIDEEFRFVHCGTKIFRQNENRVEKTRSVDGHHAELRGNFGDRFSERSFRRFSNLNFQQRNSVGALRVEPFVDSKRFASIILRRNFDQNRLDEPALFAVETLVRQDQFVDLHEENVRRRESSSVFHFANVDVVKDESIAIRRFEGKIVVFGDFQIFVDDRVARAVNCQPDRRRGARVEHRSGDQKDFVAKNCRTRFQRVADGNLFLSVRRQRDFRFPVEIIDGQPTLNGQTETRKMFFCRKRSFTNIRRRSSTIESGASRRTRRERNSRCCARERRIRSHPALRPLERGKRRENDCRREFGSSTIDEAETNKRLDGRTAEY